MLSLKAISCYIKCYFKIYKSIIIKIFFLKYFLKINIFNNYITSIKNKNYYLK